MPSARRHIGTICLNVFRENTEYIQLLQLYLYHTFLYTQVTLETPYLMTARRSIREDVLKMESTLLTLTVQTRNHSKFIATTNTPSSREEWMDPRISLEVRQTTFRASIQSGMSSGWLWRRSTVSLQELPEPK